MFVGVCERFEKNFLEISQKPLTNYFFLATLPFHFFADVAQLVELLPCKQWVGGSSPSISSIFSAVFDQISKMIKMALSYFRCRDFCFY